MTPQDLFFNILSFAVAHIFLWPVAALAVEIWLISVLGLWALLFLGVLNALYARTYWDKSQFTGNRLNEAFIKMWIGCHQYFPVKTWVWDGKRYSDTPNDGHDKTFNVYEQTFIFGMHPHGAIPLGGAVFRPQISKWKGINEQLRVAGASAVFWLPLVRDFYLMFGTVDARKEVVREQLKRGHSVMVLPGGIREQLWVCKPGEDVVLLHKHVGFIKLAVESGSPLVPVYVFGERRAYIVQERLTRFFSKVLKKLFNVGVPMVRGRWFTLMPFATPINIVIGAPLPVPKVAKDADPAVMEEAVHDTLVKYEAALVDLYNTHKEAAGYGETKLVIH